MIVIKINSLTKILKTRLIGKKHNEKINIFGIKYKNLKLDIILKFNELTYYKQIKKTI